MHATFSTERLDQDPEFRRLLLAFSEAKMNLVAYLNEHMDLALAANEKAGEINPQP